MKVLVSGFDPFGKDEINPSIEAVKRLPDKISGASIIKIEIPTVRKKSVDVLVDYIEKYSPDVVINVGQAGGRSDISVERVGINIDDFRIPDNEGNQPIDQKIYEDGDDAYFTTLPIKAMVNNMVSNGISASISNTAGTFVCNHVCYSMSYISNKHYNKMKTGFIHIPYIKEQVRDDEKEKPYMNLDDIVRGLVLCIEAIINNDVDIKMPGGKLH